MKLGIFTKIFDRPTFGEVLDSVKSYGFGAVQFNMESAGGIPMPDRITEEYATGVRKEMELREIEMAAVSGTFNMIHPDPQNRADGMRRFREIVGACGWFGTSLVTLCTGTRDPGYMWAYHPENESPEAWKDMITSMAEAVEIAEDHGVTLVFETEVSNVVDSAIKARRLMDEVKSPHLKVVMDGANLFPKGGLKRMQEILDEAFDLLGGDIAMAHAKDLEQDGEAGHVAAGTGLLDYDYYLRLLAGIGFEGTLVAHSLKEDQVVQSREFLLCAMDRTRE
jgi:sugar phosphate isomerase/epimerase